MSFCSNYFVFKDKVIANHHYRDVLIDDLPLQLASVGGDIVILALSLEVRVLGGDSETDDVIPGAADEELVVIEFANKEDKIVSEKLLLSSVNTFVKKLWTSRNLPTSS